MEDIIGYGKIKEIWAEFAMTEFAKEKIINSMPCKTEEEMRKFLKETTEAKNIVEKNGKPPLTFLLGIHEILNKTEEGYYLNGEELEEMTRVLEIVERVKIYLNNCDEGDNIISSYSEKLNSLRNIQNQIGEMIYRGKIADDASKILKKGYCKTYRRNER